MAYVLPTGDVQERVWYEWSPPQQWTVTNIVVRPGDKIYAKVAKVGLGRWRVSLADATTHRCFGQTHTFASLEESAEIVVEDPYSNWFTGETFPLPNFDPIHFTACILLLHEHWRALLSETSAAPIALTQGGAIRAMPRRERDGFTVYPIRDSD